MLDAPARNELIRRLRSRGWSLRRIARHDSVGVSAEMVRKVLAANPVEMVDDGERITVSSCSAEPSEIVGPLEFVGINEDGTAAVFVDANGRISEPLELYREAHAYPPDHPRAGQCWAWLLDADTQAEAHGASVRQLRANRARRYE
jgi:hypothetical protein